MNLRTERTAGGGDKLRVLDGTEIGFLSRQVFDCVFDEDEGILWAEEGGVSSSVYDMVAIVSSGIFPESKFLSTYRWRLCLEFKVRWLVWEFSLEDASKGFLVAAENEGNCWANAYRVEDDEQTWGLWNVW